MAGSIVMANPKWARQERNARRRARARAGRQKKPTGRTRQTPAVNESEVHKKKIMDDLQAEERSLRQGLPSHEEGTKKMAALLEKTQTMPRRPPYNYIAIVKDAVQEFDPLSMAIPDVFYRLYSGVLLEQRKKMYWVDRVSNKNCFMLFSESLEIRPRRSYEIFSFSTRVGTIGRAVIFDETEVKISGSLDTMALSASTLYVVAFVIRRRMKSSAALRFSIALPSGTMIRFDQDPGNIQENKWTEILVGEFMVSPENIGTLKFILKEDGGPKLGGLEILGVSLRPKDNVRVSTRDAYTYYVGSDAGILAGETTAVPGSA